MCLKAFYCYSLILSIMSDEEVDHELLALLRKSLGLDDDRTCGAETRVLQDAEFIYNNSIDVAIDYRGTKAAAATIWSAMEKQGFSLKTWSLHELHPKTKDEATVNFIFTMDLLNFCFWPEESSGQGFAVEYHGQRWTGYWSLVAVLQRALDEGRHVGQIYVGPFSSLTVDAADIPITDPHFWPDQNECTDEILEHVFRSDSSTQIPLLEQRIACLREAGTVMYEVSIHDHSWSAVLSLGSGLTAVFLTASKKLAAQRAPW